MKGSDAIDRELDKWDWPLTRWHARQALGRAMDARVTELLEANNREVERRRRAESADGIAQIMRAARLLTAAAEDARMILKDLPRTGLCPTPNQRMVMTQVLTNINNALLRADENNITRAANLDGDG